MEKIFEVIIQENNDKQQTTHSGNSSGINAKKKNNILRHNIFKLQKTKDGENLEKSRDKNNYRKTRIRITNKFSSDTMQAKRVK